MRSIYILLLSFLICGGIQATDYYISSSTGLDTNSGTSSSNPLQSLAALNALTFGPGDRILFKSGDSWTGMFWLKGSGAAGQPIVVDKYGGSVRPLIDGDGYQACILVYNDEYIEIKNLELTNEASHLDGSGIVKKLPGYGGADNDWGSGKNVRFGLKFVADTDSMRYFRIDNLFIHDIYPTPTNIDNKHQGYGMKFEGQVDHANAVYPLISDIIVENCYVTETGHYGLWTKVLGNMGSDLYKHDGIIVRNNTFLHTGGSGFVSGFARNLLVHDCLFDHPGSNSDPQGRMWARGSGYWAFNSKNVIIEKNEFLNARGYADSYGAHIDYSNENIVFQYNYSFNNEGGFVEVLGENINCGYRYNISVNDGWRLDPEGLPWKRKGKIFWVSGYCGGGPGCPNTKTFIYNNTAYVPNTLNPEIYVKANSGETYIYNNVVYVQSGGDTIQTFLENTGTSYGISHNLFYPQNSFNLDSDLTPNAMYFDPLLLSPGAQNASMYALETGSPALSAGFLIAGSTDTLNYLQHNGGRDYFGNPVSNTTAPNLGAYGDPAGEAPLPIDLLSFEVGVEGKELHLIWMTNMEYNSDHFEIQWSEDGRDFQRIGTVKAKGHSSSPTEYRFIIRDPEEGEQYFRLKQLDLDGSFEFSPIRGVIFSRSREDIGAFYPNPITGSAVEIEIGSDHIGPMNISVFSQKGILLNSRSILLEEGVNSVQLELSELERGIYWVLFDTSQGPVYRKLIIP